MSEKTEPYGPMVLVVDDEGVIADTFVTILKHNGFAAYARYDGETAIEAALESPPSLLISDVILPGMNGVELAITIKKIFPECKIILSSGQVASSRLLSSANEAGHSFVLLRKPVQPQDLLAHVAHSLGTHA
jgi:CheY-like chemotaxis protein